MSRSKYKIYDDSFPYFITTGINFGLPIFSNPKAAEIILENLLFLKNRRNVKLIAYVIMENHLHAVLKGEDLGPKIGKLKSYSARKIIDLFIQDRHHRWLKRRKRG